MRVTLFFSLLCLCAVVRLGAEPTWALGNEVPATPGQDYKLASGSTFYLEVVDNRFFAVFIDEERIAILPPVPRIILRGEGTHPRVDPFNLVLTANGGPVLSHPRVFPPPHDFWFSVVVPRADGESEVLPRGRFRQ